MYIIAEPVTEEQVQQIQSRNKSKIKEFERSILGLHKPTDEGVPTAKSVEEDTSDWKDIHAKVEEELSRDELSSEPTGTQSSETATIGVVLNDDGSEGPPDGASLPDSGTLLAQSSPDERSEHSAVATVDDLDEEVDDEEEDNADEDNEVDAEEQSEEEGQEEGKTEGVGEGNEENTTSGTLQVEDLVHDPSEGDVAEKAVGEFAAGETPSTEDTSKVSNSEGAQEASDVVQAGSPSDVAEKGKKHADGKAVNTSPLLAMTLTVRNKVNGKFIDRPQHLDRFDKWTVEYSLAEISSVARAWSLYGACQNRRKKKLDDDDVNEEDVAKNYYLRRIREKSEQGRRWRQQQDRIESKTAAVVLDRPSPSARSHADDSSE